MSRTWKWAIGVGVSLAVLGLVSIYFLGAVIKTAVVAAGPAVVGVPIKLESAHVSLLTGVADLRGLVVGNPEGFKTEHCFTVNRFEAHLSMRSLLTDTIVIRSVRITGPSITFEQKASGSNLGTLQAQLKGRESGTRPASKASATEPGKPSGKKVRIDELVVEDATVNLSVLGMGANALALSLPPVHVTGIGANGGVTWSEAISEILAAVSTGVGNVAGKPGKRMDSGMTALGNELGTGVKAAGRSLGPLMKAVEGVVEKASSSK